jgi:pentatricopeptide repeat protein
MIYSDVLTLSDVPLVPGLVCAQNTHRSLQVCLLRLAVCARQPQLDLKTRSFFQEQDRVLALRTYRMALRQGERSLQVHTAALGTCLLDTPLDTRRSDLDTALAIYSSVQADGTVLDTRFYNMLISIAGRCGELERALGFLEDMEATGVARSGDTAANAVQAALLCGDRSAALRVYRHFLDDPESPTPAPRAFNALINAHATAADLPAAVEVLRELAAAGLRPTGGTVAALIGACQRSHQHELAFVAATVARTRGILWDSYIGFALVRTAFNKIRLLWAPPLGYPLAISTAEAKSRAATAGVTLPDTGVDEGWPEGHSDGNWPPAPGQWPGSAPTGVSSAAAMAGDPALAERLLHALSGRPGLEVEGDGPPNIDAWRDRAHGVYRCANAGCCHHNSCCLCRRRIWDDVAPAGHRSRRCPAGAT